MPKFKISTLIQKPIVIVYSAYIDQDNMLLWTTDLEKIEIVKGEFGKVGATAHLHYNQKGRKNILIDKLLHLEPAQRIISQVAGGGLTAKVETLFESLNGGTKLTLIWDGKGKNFMTKIILSFMKNKIKESAKNEVNNFKRLVENHGIKFKE